MLCGELMGWEVRVLLSPPSVEASQMLGRNCKKGCPPGQGAAETVMEGLQIWAPGQGFLQLSHLTVLWIQIQKYLWNDMETANAGALRGMFYNFIVSVSHWTLKVWYKSENVPHRHDFRFEIAALLLPEINLPKPVSSPQVAVITWFHSIFLALSLN